MCMLPPILQRSPTQRSHRVQKAKGFVVFFPWKVATAVKVTIRTISYESNYDIFCVGVVSTIMTMIMFL
jgi:hypothetical protein